MPSRVPERTKRQMNEKPTLQIRSPHFCAVPYPSGECWQLKSLVQGNKSGTSPSKWRTIECYPTTLTRAIERVWEYEAIYAAGVPSDAVMTADECREFGTYLVNRVADIADAMQARLAGEAL